MAQSVGLFREVFRNLNTNDISYPASAAFTNGVPSKSATLTDFEIPQNSDDGYGDRMRGFVLPPQTGNYTFWISSDEWSDLFLSTDETAENRVRIAHVELATGFHDWTAQASQQSTPVALEAGRRYYIEAIHRDGSGPDHLTVRWRLPDGSMEEPITGKSGTAIRLLQYKTNSLAIPALLTAMPTNVVASEGRSVTLVALANNTSPVTYQWRLNGADLPGETKSVLIIPSVRVAENDGQKYQCHLVSGAGPFDTAETKLTVLTDSEPPTATRVRLVDATHLEVSFSEPVLPASATLVGNYSIVGVGNPSSASLTDAQTAVLVFSTPLVHGQSYSLTIQGIQDLALIPNTIANGSSLSFQAYDFASDDIGKPATPGTSTPAGNGYDLSIASKDITGNSDQFQFTWQKRTGDFDVRIRVQGISASDTWAKAGLMVRGSLATNSAFAMVLATPGVEGCLFASRSVTGGAVTQLGNFPPNFPETRLRLRRADNEFTAYASADGVHWMTLGQTLVTVPSTVYFGMAVASRNITAAAVAQFRDLGTVSQVGHAETLSDVEPPGPSSRTTGLIISEIMYKPAPRAGITNNLEFVEIYNSNPYFEDVSGYALDGDIHYVIPEGTVLAGGATLVLAKDSQALRSVYAITNVLGDYQGSLKSSGTVRLLDRVNAVLLEVPYLNQAPWPVAADGTGHSLVLARPSYGEGFAQAWGISDQKGGSPGGVDPRSNEPLRAIVINEFLANSSSNSLDFIELYNHSSQPVDISGAWLSDSPTTNRFRIPSNTVLNAGASIKFDEKELGFKLSAQGETIYFVNATQTRVIDAVKYEDQRSDISMGRYPDGDREWYPMKTPSAGAANSGILIDDVVINEILYKPLSGDDNDGFVELYNQGQKAVDLSGWKFVSGIRYTFPASTVLPAGGYLVVAKNRQQLLSHYPGVLTTANTFGDYQGKPTQDSRRLALARPVPHVTTDKSGVLVTNIIYPVIDEVTFGVGGHWGDWSNGDGSSLELRDPRANHRMASNWGDSDDTAKAPWTFLEATGIVDNSAPYDGGINRLEVTMLNAAECLLDNVEVYAGTNTANRITNPGFETALAPWVPQGDHVQSSLETTEGFESKQSLHVRATARGDTGGNRIRVAMTGNIAEKQTCTIRAKARWLHGWPEMVLRLEGNGFELAGRMTVPTNLGTPGARNGGAVDNAPPSISGVNHSPALPADHEDVFVTAKVQDPDGVANVKLFYRLDPDSNYTTLAMNDSGTAGDLVAGDGVFTATIPGQTSGTLVAFYVTATDAAGVPKTSQLPEDAPARECLIRFGEPTPASGFGTYHFYLTANTVKTWINRPSISNERLFGTFVYGNYRVVYNISGKYAGSPYHQGWTSPATTAGCHFSLEFPLDDLLLGTENFNKIHGPGNGAFDDGSLQREQTAYWVMRKMGLPYNYRRFVAMYVNGSRKGDDQTKGAYMEDTQTPGTDVLRERFPNDNNGNIYKLQPWFEFDEAAVTGGSSAGFNNVSWCTLMNFYTGVNGNIKKLARYRYNFLTRAANGTANDYTNVWDLTDAANTPPGGDYIANMKHLVDMEQWMRTFAVQHSVGNWDSFGNRNSQNMYGYKPQNGKWVLMTWDFNIVLGNSGSDGPTGDDLFQYQTADTAMLRIYQTPEFKRMSYRAFKEIAEGPMAGPEVGALMDAKYRELVASGSNPTDPKDIKGWLATRRDYLKSQLKSVTTNFNVFGSADYETNSNFAILSGSAPVEAKKITINGQDYPLTWVSVTSWRIRVPLDQGTNTFVIQAVDLKGNDLAGMVATNVVRKANQPSDPTGVIVFNEIQYNPNLPSASFIELYNTSATESFDISGWRIDGAGFTFPFGTVITNGQYLVVARDRTMLWRAYGDGVPALGDFSGNLSNAGEVLSLIRPGATLDADVVIDRVRYEPDLPWPQEANGLGSSLQLIDASRDNSRVSNWGVAKPDQWQKITITGTNKGPRLYLILSSPGEGYIDDISLTDTSGNNVVVNGDFESPLSANWIVPTNYSATTVSTDVAHTGQHSLKISSRIVGSTATNNSVWQDLQPIVTNGVYTLTYWYLPGTNAYALFVRTIPTTAITTSNLFAASLVSPGAPNQNVGSMTAYPEIWLNEILPYNRTGATDNQGDHESWVELYNAGSTAVTLDDYYLTDDYSKLTQWRFPSGTSLRPHEFRVIWLDGETEATTLTDIHANFRPSLTNGTIALVRSVQGQPQVDSYINYPTLAADESFGSFPDGQPFYLQRLSHPTSGAPNDATPPPVRVNEWMADNGSFLANPIGGKFNDWFELYNPADVEANLGGYYLTDSANNKNQFAIPAGTLVPAHGYRLVWADKQSSANTNGVEDLHVNFNLKKSGGVIALISPSLEVVDEVSYNQQTNNVSQGRYPDGSDNIQFMVTPTPRAKNILGSGGNTPPELAPIANQVVNEGTRLTFTATAADAESALSELHFSLGAGAPAGAVMLPDGRFRWRPTEAQGPATYTITVNVSDSGTPPLTDSTTFQVRVNEFNLPPIFDARSHYGKVGQLLRFATATDPDIPSNTLVFSLPQGGPSGLALDAATGIVSWTPAPAQVGHFNLLVQAVDNGTPSLSASYNYSLEILGDNQTLLVSDIAASQGAVTISCQGIVGKTYQLEVTSDLVHQPWTFVGKPVQATTTAVVFQDPIVPGVKSYYRIVQQD